ncbi:MAG: hypothetical protein ACI9ON_002736 [Limisphaerales bacterium]|jgi:hypothetical protein
MSSLLNGLRLMFIGQAGWKPIADDAHSALRILLTQTTPLALIPAICWYFGVTQSGWQIAGDPVRLTAESALPMCILFFLACVAGVMFLGFMVYWMSTTYGDKASVSQGITLISYTATPFFVSGIIGLYPIIWLDIIVGMSIACYCIYLLYTGVSPIMKVTRERGFLYASATFAVALVAFVGLLGVTVLLWEFGPSPEYTY